MKPIFLAMAALISFNAISGNNDPSRWSSKKIDRWFGKQKLLKALNVSPDKSINKRAFAVAWFRNRDRWDKAFDFLLHNDFSKMEPKRYDIDGDNVYATVSEYLTKEESVADYEAHRKYTDIQYVVSGKELIGIAPVSEKTDVTGPYDPSKDIEFMHVREVRYYPADPQKFFIFFPEDAHKPGIKDGQKTTVRKVVIKIKVD